MTIQDFAFAPIRVRTTMVRTRIGVAAHTVTVARSKVDSGARAQGKTFLMQ